MRKLVKEHRKYGLLENNTIENLYYSNGEERIIVKEKDSYYLYHDVFQFDKDGKLEKVHLYKHKIVRESDNMNFLKKLQKDYNDKVEKLKQEIKELNKND